MVCVKHAPVPRVLTLVFVLDSRCASSLLSLLSANELHQCCLTFLTSIADTKKDDRQRRAVNPRDLERASSQPSVRQVQSRLSTPRSRRAPRRPQAMNTKPVNLGLRVHRIKAPSRESRSARWRLTRRRSAPPTSPTLGCPKHGLHRVLADSSVEFHGSHPATAREFPALLSSCPL